MRPVNRRCSQEHCESRSRLTRIERDFFMILFIVVFASSAFGQSKSDHFGIPDDVQTVLNNRCLDCHGSGTAEGDVRLDTLAVMPLPERLELLNKAQDQLFFGLMPPEDAEQPSKADRHVGIAGKVEIDLKAVGEACGPRVDQGAGKVEAELHVSSRIWRLNQLTTAQRSPGAPVLEILLYRQLKLRLQRPVDLG